MVNQVCLMIHIEYNWGFFVWGYNAPVSKYDIFLFPGSAPLTHNVIVKASRLLHLKATKPYVLESAISLTCQEVAEQAHIWKNQKAGYAESLRQFFDNHFNGLYIE